MAHGPLVKFHGMGSCAGAWPYKSYSESALLFEKFTSLFVDIDQAN